MSEQAFFTQRRVMRCAQTVVGVLNALSLMLHLSHGAYWNAAVDVFCLAVVADWLIPGDPPRRSWVLAVAWFVVGIFTVNRVRDQNRRLLDVVETMSQLLDVGKSAMDANVGIRLAASGLRVAWERVEALHRQAGVVLPDEAVMLRFDGVETPVTAGELRALMAAIYGK